MILLPPLTAGSRIWRLPLSNHAALRLTNALLHESGDERRELLARLLDEEPALLLWCVCRAADFCHAPPANLLSVADWFDKHALTELFSEQRGESRALLVVEPTSAATGSDDVSFSSLRIAPRLLSECGPAVSLDDDSADTSCLPAWLGTRLRTERSPPDHSLTFSLEPGDAPETGDTSAVDFSLLARRLSRLRELESRFAATVEQEKLAALKELAYGASHEINNPLANISTRAQSLLRDERDPERRRKLATINSQAFRAHEMIADLMMFAKPPPLRPALTDVTAILDAVLAELAREAEEQGTLLRRTSPDAPLVITADAEQLAVALKAICANSLQAIGAGGRIEVAARSGPGTNGAMEITVRDTGPGIPPQVRRNLFDPFYSGREAGRGLGFGLAKCWRIVAEHGGSIDVDSEPGRGATFTIRLPFPLPFIHGCG